ncbi:Zinc finger, C3HC4 type (RING finger) [Carpediemonas membranifera]|uniref:Zinc finger, C3HC4 type (RING finger) n=1 Tax=Carpediemonas membranifera TaxID=201153 RepID=A0A8J6C0S1_9EUKA|nr:Zinc finger, C3HC4 type (RING finger) [Carpediemonas membranifera]|eukprot:KAG9396876.1 Zinc finger, C3HC4 type (RING finger) [Carpediemonas membranifera]
MPRVAWKTVDAEIANELMAFTISHERSMPHIRHTGRHSRPYEVMTASDYVNAKCRLTVQPTNSYMKVFADPNNNVDWDDIKTISVMARSERTCPICLGEPVVPIMLKCGHIFCWSCFMAFHYLTKTQHEASYGVAFRPCPVCNEPTRLSHARLCDIELHPVPGPNTVAEMSLIRRLRGTHLCWPASDPARASSFTRLWIGTDMRRVFGDAFTKLAVQKIEEGMPTGRFVESAQMHLAEEAYKTAVEFGNEVPPLPETWGDREPWLKAVLDSDALVLGDRSAMPEDTAAVVAQQRLLETGTAPKGEVLTFYQATNGARLVLNSTSFSALTHHVDTALWGTPPPKLTVLVHDIASCRMGSVGRPVRFLDHMPKYTSIEWVNVAWTGQTSVRLGKETIAKHGRKLSLRRPRVKKTGNARQRDVPETKETKEEPTPPAAANPANSEVFLFDVPPRSEQRSSSENTEPPTPAEPEQKASEAEAVAPGQLRTQDVVSFADAIGCLRGSNAPKVTGKMKKRKDRQTLWSTSGPSYR